MSQPDRKFLANLGDVNPLDHGGFFVYDDGQAEILERDEECRTEERYFVRRLSLDRCKIVDGHLVPHLYEPSWPRPAAEYVEWFDADLLAVALCVDTNLTFLQANLCSEDPVRRALAYQALASYHGWDNLNAGALALSRAEVERRYTKGEFG